MWGLVKNETINELNENKEKKLMRNCEIYAEWQVGEIDQENQLGSFHFSDKFPGGRMSSEKSEKINWPEMPGMRNDIHKAETYNKYGDDARKIEIASLGKHDTFIRVDSSGIT